MSGNGRRNRPASKWVPPSSITSSNIKRRTRRSGSGQQRGRCRDDFHGHQVDDQRRVPVPHDGRQKRRARRAQRVGGFQSESCIIIVVPTPTLRWYKDDHEFVPKSSSYEKRSARLVLANTSKESGRRTSKLSDSRKGRSTLSESSAGIRPGLLTGRRYRSRKTDDPSIPPSDLRVAEVTSCSVTLQWAPPISTGGTE